MPISFAKLSGADDDNTPIKITGTDTAGAVDLHGAVGGTDGMDEVQLQVWTNHTTYVDVTFEIGSSAKTMVVRVYPGDPPMPLSFWLCNSAVLSAFASVANVAWVGSGPVVEHR